MNFQIKVMPACLLACLAMGQVFADEDEHRHHDSHEHGVAEMNLAVDGTKVMIELESPAANIVGFEHAPHNDDERNQIKQAIHRMEQAETLFVFTPEAKCQLEVAEVETELAKGHDDHDDHADSHGHKEKDDHGHEENDHHGHEAHDKHGHEKNHEHKESGETHSEFNASYVFTCKAIDKLKQVDVNLFTEFKGMEEIKAQVISANGQSLEHLSPKQSRIDL